MPCLIQAGMTGISYNDATLPDQKEWVQALFSSLGDVAVVPETDIDIITGISGSGPGFLYEIAYSIAQVGKSHGLSDELSLKLIAQTMIGSGKMLLTSNKGPHTLIKEVCSPGGTTITGLTAFRQSNAHEGIQAMVNAAIRRAKELSN
jgi:pyrroline-5-carboxylate reductase